MNTFEDTAKKFGHDLSQLKKGDEIHSVHEVSSLDDLRDLLHDGSTKKTRKERLETIKNSHPKLMDQSNSSVDAIHLRAAAAVHADHELHADDKLMLASSFPAKINLVSAVDKKVSEEWTLGTSTVVAYNIGTLTIEGQGYINAFNTHVTFNVQTLINNVNQSPVNYTFGIFGVTGQNGIAGTAPANQGVGQPNPGASSGTPSPGVCTGAKTAQAGGNGSPGGPGGEGQQGGDGLPSLIANLSFNDIQGNPVSLLTQSGAGGLGGVGGQGASGGAGGKGGDGCQSGCEGTQSANGGNGGAGGNGGNGGPGGNGVNGQPVAVTLGSAVAKNMFSSAGTTASAGIGGAGGASGSGGAGGSGGSGSGKHRSAGNTGTPGSPGTHGTNGTQGKFSGNPGVVTVSASGS